MIDASTLLLQRLGPSSFRPILRFDRASPRRADAEFCAVLLQLRAEAISNDAASEGI